MKGLPKDLTSVAIDDLVQLYITIALAQFAAREDERIARYNRLFGDWMNVSQELKSRPGDERRTLRPLLDHDNFQVQFNCAIDLLALFPEEAMDALRRIHEQDWRFYYADAGTLLESIASGRFVPQ